MADTLRPARASDVADLRAIETAVFVPPAYEPMSARQFRRHAASPRAVLLVCERAGRVIGYALGLSRAGGHFLRVYSLAVAPAAQGGTVGRDLFTAMEGRARAAGLGVIVEIRADNRRLHERYLGLGYREFSRPSGYYPDGCGAIRMKRLFTQP